MPKTVYVIDDDEHLQLVLEIALSESGYNVELASNGEEALARLHHLSPDLVLCDVVMPYLDGAQVWQVLRERLQYSGVPFVLVTALERKSWFADLEADGVVILYKPFSIDQLLSLVGSFLDE